MRRAITSFIVATSLCALSPGAEHKTWSKIRYVGGTVVIKTSPYDYNTTLTVGLNPEPIVVAIAPARPFAPLQTIRIKPDRVISLSLGQNAWNRVSEVRGAKLPARAPSLFGLLEDHGFMGIVYKTDEGKPAAILLDTYYRWPILSVLKELTGKGIEGY
ncbi:hypothetical protein [uncultured Paludibaculum sp.]|uniref:hypothetical protein n=1 Tax=uncultured Paludibaculum sp. TaxID=1765020 RepID=UPI002AABE0C2|nr:hypothetical protein [uncultured Paludibaculum sp.]